VVASPQGGAFAVEDLLAPEIVLFVTIVWRTRYTPYLLVLAPSRFGNLWGGFVHQAVSEHDSMDVVIFQLLKTLQAAQCNLFAMVLWSLWKHRNLKLWQQIHETTTQVAECAKHMLDDWVVAQELRINNNMHGNTAGLRSRTPNDIQWQRPTLGRLKCNIDAFFSYSLNKVGIDICIKNFDHGSYVLAKIMCLTLLCSLDVGEALGLNHALQ